MTKALVLALAALAFAGQAAHAQVRADRAGKGLRAVEEMRRTEDTRRDSRNAAPAVNVSAESVRIQQSISSSGLSGVTSQSAAELAKHANDPIVKRGFDAAIANKNAAPDLVSAQLNLLSLIPTMKGSAQAKEIVSDLTIGAGTKAAKWPDAKARENVKFLIERVQEYVVQGKDADQALDLAKADLKKDKGVDIDLAKIKDLCK